MANDVDAGKQEALEARFKDFAGSPLDQNMNVRDVFGDMDEWTLELGPYRFLLLPFNGEWWFYDSAHDYWKYTGYHAGEVKFIVNGEDIELRLRVAGSSGTGVPVRAGVFCTSCGAPVARGLIFVFRVAPHLCRRSRRFRFGRGFVTQCGAGVVEGAKFCTKCGKRL